MNAQPLTEAEFRRALDGMSDSIKAFQFIRRILFMSKFDSAVAAEVRDFCSDYDIPLDAREEG